MKPDPRIVPPATHRPASGRIIGLTTVAVLTSMVLFILDAVPPAPAPAAAAVKIAMAPEGGRLDALDDGGYVVGPCPLEHTDVRVDVSGHISRVTLTQRYHNPYGSKIEAVYTFPMSHRAAVDRMTMRVGDRVVVGEVKERGRARMIYEAAREAGFVAGLLDQERPNIFTQSIANIEPGAEVIVEISYVELVRSQEGRYTFDFPMVVGPRYIPGGPPAKPVHLPAGFTPRLGLVLLAPPLVLEPMQPGDVSKLGTLQPGKLRTLLDTAQPVSVAEAAAGDAAAATLWYAFKVEYVDGTIEIGTLHTDGTGQLGGRPFFVDPDAVRGMGTGFSPDTDQVPDASRVTPMPVKPGTRAGHDISIRVNLETGGPRIVSFASDLHEVVRLDGRGDRSGSRVILELAKRAEIPNRDFVLSWTTATDRIQEAVFTHRSDGGRYGPYGGGFFTLILEPPDRVDDAKVRPRELVFVMDVSGSMSGFPIEKSKEVMRLALDAMRPEDTFNVITFAGRTAILWDAPRHATERNRELARAFVDEQRGGGGTEMMKAIHAALVQEADAGRRMVRGRAPMRICVFLTDGYVGDDMEIVDAVRANANTTRVFSFGIGNAVNRYLLDGMARAGRGEVEYVLLDSDADGAVARLARRIQTPVLTDIEVAFGGGLEVHDVLPGTAPGEIPDLFDVQPLVVHGRYAKPGRGTVTIRGRTAAGRYERVLKVEFPEREPAHDVIATLWAREKVEALMDQDLAAAQAGTFPAEQRQEIVALGEAFQIMSQFTSFVAVEKSRVTIGGRPVLVPVPIEMPEGVSWEGVFGEILKDEDVIDEGEWSGPFVPEDKDEALRVAAGEALHALMQEPAARGLHHRGGRSGEVMFFMQPPAAGGPGIRKQVGAAKAGAPFPAWSGPAAPAAGALSFDAIAEGDAVGRDRVRSDAGPDFVKAPSLEEVRELRRARQREGTKAAFARSRFFREVISKLGRPVLSSRVAVLIADLVSKGELQGARWLAEELAVVEPGFEIGVALRDALVDGKLGAKERDRRIEALGAKARALFERKRAGIERRATLRRVVDARLWGQVPEMVPAATSGGDSIEVASPDGAILVAVLVGDLNEKTVRTLERAGLVVEARCPSAGFVVGRVVPRAALAEIALLDAVRRIEPLTRS